MKKSIIITFVFCAALVSKGVANAANPARPPRAPLPSGRYQRTTILPELSEAVVEGLKQQQDGSVAKGRLRIGVGRNFDQPVVVSPDTAPASEWSTLSDGWRVWSLDVGSKGALGLRLHLENLVLPPGARLLIYDPAKPASTTSVLTAADFGSEREFWTGTIFSDRVILQCQVPPDQDTSRVRLTVSAVSHLYLMPMGSSNTKEGTCHSDVTCFPAYAQDASGVARISFVDSGDTLLCSGCLVAASGSADYFLTAHHCVDSQKLASTLEFFWFFQTSSCNGAAPDVNSVPTTSGGADLLASASASDFTFVRLRHAAPGGAAHLQWTLDPPTTTETLVCIHHPTGAYKRISFGKLINSDNNFWDVRWSTGVTEPGSSGSPLLNGNHQIVGQLNGGFNGPGSSCQNPSAPDQYGRFDVTFGSIKSWLGGTGGNGSGTKGTFYGLLSDPAGISQESSGLFTMTASSKGKFSGKIIIGSYRYGFKGQFDAGGSAEVHILRRFATSLTLDLLLDSPTGADHLTGTLASDDWTANIDANQNIYDGRTSFSPDMGQYTMVINGDSDPSQGPGGDSYGTITVDKSGRIRLVGSLADGTKFTQAAAVSKDSGWPMYVPLYSGQGSLFSRMAITSGGTSDLNGNINWIKPKLLNAKLYKSGFTLSSAATGSRFTRPSKGGVVVDFNAADLILLGASLDQSVTNQVTIGPNNRVTNVGGNKFKLSFSATSGAFSGSTIDPATGLPAPFRGVVLQRQNTGSGYFTSGGQSGEVLLVPDTSSSD